MRKAARAIVVKDKKLLLMKRNKFGQEYYSLIGGGLEPGETGEQALHREVGQEASLTVKNPRLVIIEQAGQIYGVQFIYLCDYESGEPELDSNSEEAKISAMKKNLYTPLWVPVKKLPNINLLPVELKDAVIEGLEHGFPKEPLLLNVPY
jgi:8-oxo-dGTP diphosphatase